MRWRISARSLRNLAIVSAESAAAFEELTLSRQIDSLKMQTPDSWPNTFRQSRFVSAVDFVQADRFRRMVAQEMQRVDHLSAFVKSEPVAGVYEVIEELDE